MDKLTKDEVILQLANMASGIERTTGDSLKAKALREAISFLDDDGSNEAAGLDYKETIEWERYRQAENKNMELAAHVAQLREGLNNAIEALVSETNTSGVVEEYEIHDLRTLEMSVPKSSLEEYEAILFDNANTTGYMKAVCIGEFSFTLEKFGYCHECGGESSENCHVCNGDSDENGNIDVDVASSMDHLQRYLVCHE